MNPLGPRPFGAQTTPVSVTSSLPSILAGSSPVTTVLEMTEMTAGIQLAALALAVHRVLGYYFKQHMLTRMHKTFYIYQVFLRNFAVELLTTDLRRSLSHPIKRHRPTLPWRKLGDID